MNPRPVIFISAVSKELKTARGLAARLLHSMGYDPKDQDMARTEHGSLRGVLRKWIDQSEGVIQLVGTCHGAEPREPDAEFGRVSYTQFEALYARKCGEPVWYFFVGEGYTTDPNEPEPEELLALQRAYREGIREANDVRHTFSNNAELENCIHRLRDDLTKLRHGAKRLTAFVLVLLALSVAGVALLLKSGGDTQKKITRTETKVDALPRAVTEAIERISVENAASGGKDDATRRTLLFAELEKKYGLTAGTLAAELPEMARKRAEDAAIPKVDRAKAALAALDYAEAERLALEAYADNKKAVPLDKHKLINALILAGWSAGGYRDDKNAVVHFTDASKLTDKTADALEWARVHQALAYALYQGGEYAQAERLVREVIAISMEELGAEHPDTLASRSILPIMLQAQGKNADTEKELRAVMAIIQRVLGAEHHGTMANRNNLAGALWAQGKNAEAEREFRAVLEFMQRVLGAEHHDTLASRNNLAAVLWAQGKNAEAEQEFRAVLEIRQRVLGAEHPDTLVSRNNLAGTLPGQGKLAEAEREGRAVVEIRQRVLGAEHPDTLASRNNLAIALQAQGKNAEAAQAHRAVLELRTRVLGPEHPDTLKSRMNVAMALDSQDQVAEAEKEYRAVLAIQERVLGPEHPDTLASRRGLANAMASQGMYAEAEVEHMTVLATRERVLGPDHPDTLSSRKDLAVALQGQHKYANAEKEYRTVLSIKERILGPEHRDTLMSWGNLASALVSQGNHAGAEKEYREVLAILERLPDPGHPEVFQTCYNLAMCLAAQEKLQEALIFIRRAETGEKKVLGAEHPYSKNAKRLREKIEAELKK